MAELKRLDEVPQILDVIERLCVLVEEVSRTYGYSHPTDCFCSRGGFWKNEGGHGPNRIRAEYWRHNPESSIAFIERATREALERQTPLDGALPED